MAKKRRNRWWGFGEQTRGHARGRQPRKRYAPRLPGPVTVRFDPAIVEAHRRTKEGET